MVFESVLTQVLNSVLGDYVENLDTKQLNVGIWGGDVKLSNLQLKQSALNNLDLPIQALYGRIGKLVLKIPWKNLYGAAFVINVEDIYLLAAPNVQSQYDPEKEKAKLYEAKKLLIKNVELAKKMEVEKAQIAQKADYTFVEKLITQIIKNLQLNIKNIHIRYEDKMTNPESPFAFGVTLGKLNVVSTDENWKPAITQENISKIFKIVELEALGVYWNCNSKPYSEMSHVTLIDNLTKGIATEDFVPNEHSYILGPINAWARLRMNQKPESDQPAFSIPKIHLTLDLKKLYIGLGKSQYQDLIALSNSMDRMIKAEPYRKYRPNVPGYKGHYTEWWKFAYRCVLEEDVRRVRRNWNWDHICEHRNLCKKYAVAYQSKYSPATNTAQLTPEMEEMEQKLDVFNIIVIRQRVELEAERLKKKQDQNKSQQGWLGWMWGSKSAPEAESEIQEQFANAMTPEEKQKMYKAIGYQEGAPPPIYPESYVDISATFLLRLLEIQVKDDALNGGKTALVTELKGVKCCFDKRSSAQAMKVHVKIDEFTTYGLEQDDEIPHLITSETGGGDSALLEVTFETNPLDKKCDQRLHLNAQPLKIIYDAGTINKIVDIFTVPSSSTALDQISTVAGNGLSNIKEMSASGLQHAIEEHNLMDLNIDLQAPIILIPYGGKYAEFENILVVNLGNLKVYTEERPQSITNVRKMFAQGRDQNDIMKEMIDQSYDRFNLSFTDLQVVLAQGGEDWKTCVKESKKTDMHLLVPVSLKVQFHKCLITDDWRLPLSKVNCELPSINVSVSDARLLVLYSLVMSIPLPSEETSEEVVLQPLRKQSSTFFQAYEEAKLKKKKLAARNSVVDEAAVKMINMQVNFVMKELQLTIYHQEHSTAPMVPIASLEAENLECNITMKKYALSTQVRLANINLKQFRPHDIINIISLPTSNAEKNYLFNLDFTQVDPKTPDFAATYDSIKMKISLDVCALWFNLHQEGLLALMQFATQFQNDYEDLANPTKDMDLSGSTLKRTVSIISGSLPFGMIDIKNDLLKRTQDTVNLVEVVDLQLKAKFEEFKVFFATDRRKISECTLKGIEGQVVMKPSCTIVNARLLDITVLDLNPISIHKKILSVMGEETLSVQIILNTLDEGTTDKSDVEVEATVAGIRVFFLNWFVTSMLNFLNNFQTAQTAIIEASQAAAETAKQNVQEAYSKETKVSLNINLKAPDIIIPINSKSKEALFFDLGHITVTNRFNVLEVETKDGKNKMAVIDRVKISLTQLKLSKIKVDRNEIMDETTILEPITSKLIIKRNLSLSWYRVIPDVDISGNIDEINIRFNQTDMETMMKTLNGNLAEGGNEHLSNLKKTISTTSLLPSALTTSVSNIVHDNIDHTNLLSIPPTVHTTMRFTFTMDKLIISLYTGGTKVLTDDRILKDTPLESLAKFSLEGLSCKGRTLSDNTFSTSVLLINCILDDLRPSQTKTIYRMIERTINDNDHTDKIRSMLDITFQQKGNEMFADVRVFSFTVILSMEFLAHLRDFFMNSLEAANQANPAPSRPSSAKSTSSKTTSTVQSQASMTINLKIEKPDIILVEHMDNIDTSALMFNTEIQLKYRQSGLHQVINGTIKDLELYTCNYNPSKRYETKTHVLHPITVSIAGSTPPDKGLHVELIITHIQLCVSPPTIGLLSSVMATIGTASKTADENEIDPFQFSQMWDLKPYDEDNFWFFKTESGFDALETIDSQKIEISVDTASLDELCLISVPSIVITLEAGVGNKSIPMLLFESNFQGNARNWSSQLNVDATLNIMMGYYNSTLALWEPLIEPVEVEKNGKVSLVPWEIKFDMSINNSEDSNAMSPIEGDMTSIQQIQPVTNIDITSTSTLELTMTKTCLEVLTNLANAFTTAMGQRDMVPSTKVSPYKFINMIGSPVTLMLQDGSFDVLGAGEGVLNEAILESGAEVYLVLKKSGGRKSIQSTLSDALISQSYEVKNRFLNVKINNKNSILELPFVRSDKRFFMLNYRGSGNNNWGVISDVKIDEGVLTATLRSILQVYNHFNVPIEVFYMKSSGNEIKRIAIVNPNNFINVPLVGVYTPTNEIFFAVEGYSVTSIPFVWKELQLNVTIEKSLYCTPKNVSMGTEPFTIRAIGKMEQVYYENTSRHTMSSTCYNIDLRPSVSLKNCLPIPIVCCIENVVAEIRLNAGDTAQLPNVNPGQSAIVIRLENYLEKEWSCRQEISSEDEEFSVWTFNNYDSSIKMILNLGAHRIKKNGTIQLTIYCPFWMLNKTGLLISYKNSDDGNNNVIHHPPDYKAPILFSFSAKNFFSKKKASLRVRNGDWSDKFSLDVAGSSGVVVCKTDGIINQIGVLNQLTYSGLTKQITLTPYYVIINNATFPMEFQESIRPADSWLRVEAESCAALWPLSEFDDKLLRLRICGTKEISQPFLYTESHTTLLRLDNKYGGINVDIQITEGGIYISLASYSVGMAPALVINHTRDDMNFWEKQSTKIKIVKKKHSMLYTWENPSGPRILTWETGNKQEMENDLRKDGVGEYDVPTGYKIYWVSFLDGMQRVLLFTEDNFIAESVQSAKQFELIQQELTVSLHGLGLSLINNEEKKAIMYLGITSSGIIWEQCKFNSSRFKHMSVKESAALEAAYQDYLISPSSTSTHVGKMEVNFALGQMHKPHKRKLRRSFQTGLWFQQKSSPSQLQLHAKINHLQIDNQMQDCVFPVVLSTVSPPKSIALNSGIKPFAEMSIVQLLIKNSQIKQFKYFKVLIQEFHIKVDLGFVNAIMQVLMSKEYTEQEEKDRFMLDMKLADEPLYTHVSTQALQEQKSFYDLLHFSPLKIHVSFSMSGSTEDNETSNFLNVILNSVGVTITDMQDVIFKLAYFEREYTFLTQKQLINEASRHYIGQGIKQLYVLVLGLDVLGNPYGLVLGITQGVEDLFYEPFQGAIQGPGEFAEGLVLGVRSLFGHTVGGAAGAVSRITGAMGKGIAALTFDDDFQRRRRDQINKKPTSVQEGIARGGKGLVMGVVDGVTGVITKPISGAKQEGFGGFFKGLGKGAVGLVARPTSGVIDFASGSLDAVKRATDVGEEATRLRPPRFIQSDGLVKAYNRQEADGFKLLIELEKGKYAKTDIYVFHYVVIEKKEILLLTDQRLAYTAHNDLFGGWQIEWQFTWQDMVHPVQVVPKGILIPSVEKKKKLGIFGSSETGKIILIENSATREIICRKIESLRGNI